MVASSVVVLVSIFVAADIAFVLSFNDGVVVIALITSLFTDVVTVLTSEKSFFLEIACGGDFANTTDFVVSRVIVVGIAGEAKIVLVFVVGYAGVGNGVSAVVSGVTEGNMFTGFVVAGFVS